MKRDHKTLTNHIRKRLKVEGINARVKMQTGNAGTKVIVVAVPSYDDRFTDDEINRICLCAKANGLTFVKGEEINPFLQERLTDKQQWDFYL